MADANIAVKSPSTRTSAAPAAPSASTPRQPRHRRGELRYQELLKATEALLNKENPDEIGLYQIAEKAGASTASVYHFFPTKEAAFTALMRAYFAEIWDAFAEPMDASAVRGWQDVLRIDLGRARRFHNEHPAMLKITYGGYGGVATRVIDKLTHQRLTSSMYQRLDGIFFMPPMPSADQIFEIDFAIVDAIWGISFRRHGEITDEFLQEAITAAGAYIAQFLPARLEPREVLIAAAARKQGISLPFPSREDAPETA